MSSDASRRQCMRSSFHRRRSGTIVDSLLLSGEEERLVDIVGASWRGRIDTGVYRAYRRVAGQLGARGVVMSARELEMHRSMASRVARVSLIAIIWRPLSRGISEEILAVYRSGDC